MMFFNRNTGQKSLPNYAPDSGGASGWRGRRQSRTDETRDFNIYDGCEDEPAENANRGKRSETFWKIWKIVRMVKAVKMDNKELTAFLKAYASGMISLPEGMLQEDGTENEETEGYEDEA